MLPQLSLVRTATQVRATVLTTSWAPALVVTYHPSAVLRAPDQGAHDRAFALLTADLRLAAAQLSTAGAAVEG